MQDASDPDELEPQEQEELPPPLELLQGTHRVWVSDPPPWVERTAAGVVPGHAAAAVAATIHAGAPFLATYSADDLLARRDELQRAFDIQVGTPEELLPVIQALAPEPAPRGRRARSST